MPASWFPSTQRPRAELGFLPARSGRAPQLAAPAGRAQRRHFRNFSVSQANHGRLDTRRLIGSRSRRALVSAAAAEQAETELFKSLWSPSTSRSEAQQAALAAGSLVPTLLSMGPGE
jgi:hypothetical protein